MRIKIRENILTIPNKLISEIDKLDIETANAINTLIEKGERVISMLTKQSKLNN